MIGALRVNKLVNCGFTSFLTVFQSCQDDGRVIIKAVCNGSPFTAAKISTCSGSRIRECLISRSALNLLNKIIWKKLMPLMPNT